MVGLLNHLRVPPPTAAIWRDLPSRGVPCSVDHVDLIVVPGLHSIARAHLDGNYFVSGVGVVGGHSRHRRLLSFGHRLPPTVYAAVDNEVVCQTHAYVGVMVAEHTIVGRRFESTLNERKVRPGWVDQSAWKLKCLTRRTYLGELYPFFAQWVIQRGGRGCFRHGVVCSSFETRTASLHSWLGAPYLHVNRSSQIRSISKTKMHDAFHVLGLSYYSY